MKAPETNTEAEYIQRINRVFTHIDNNLHRDLSLDQVAKIAHFSPFHFHRIFKTVVGETLNEYITRQRLTKAANFLSFNQEANIGNLAFEMGFSSNAVFSRAFKRFFGKSPSEYHQQQIQLSKIGKGPSKQSKDNEGNNQYVRSIINLLNWIDMNATIEVKEMPKMNMAYITCFGEQEIKGAFERLMGWAGPKGLLVGDDLKMATVYHESFKTTAADKVRMSSCLITNQKLNPEGEISSGIIEGGKTLVGRFEIGVEEFEKAWSSMFLWMNENGYTKSNLNPYELYLNDYTQHPENKFILDICIPVN